MSKIKIEDIRKELEQYGWKLISNSYKNLEEEMIFECEENHKVYSSWKKIRNKKECPICKKNHLKESSNRIIPKPKGATRIIGLDQATKITGYSIFDDNKLVKFGTYETTYTDEIARDHAVKVWLINLIENWHPDFIAIEGIQLQEHDEEHRIGVTMFATLARLQGILMELCYENNIPYDIYSASTWRKYCGVKGKHRVDKKKSMQILAKEWYDINISNDEADAIGIGKYASENYKKQNKIENWE